MTYLKKVGLKVLWVVCLLIVLSTTAYAEVRPNIIVIMADDLGYADVGCYGCIDIPTPHIDQLAEDGVRFTSGYVTYHMCGPSRAGFLSGRIQSTFAPDLWGTPEKAYQYADYEWLKGSQHYKAKSK